MLRRVTSDRYEADQGDRIQIVTQAQNNNGVNDARFEYGGTVLAREVIQGLPGGSFIVDAGRRRFQAVVAFDPSATNTARYDVFEVDASGGLTDLRQHVSRMDSAPLVGFAVEGLRVAAAAKVMRRVATPPSAKRAAPVKSVRKSARKKTAGKKTAAKVTRRARKSPARKLQTRRRSLARKR